MRADASEQLDDSVMAFLQHMHLGCRIRLMGKRHVQFKALCLDVIMSFVDYIVIFKCITNDLESWLQVLILETRVYLACLTEPK